MRQRVGQLVGFQLMTSLGFHTIRRVCKGGFGQPRPRVARLRPAGKRFRGDGLVTGG